MNKGRKTIFFSYLLITLSLFFVASLSFAQEGPPPALPINAPAMAPQTQFKTPAPPEPVQSSPPASPPARIVTAQAAPVSTAPAPPVSTAPVPQNAPPPNPAFNLPPSTTPQTNSAAQARLVTPGPVTTANGAQFQSWLRNNGENPFKPQTIVTKPPQTKPVTSRRSIKTILHQMDKNPDSPLVSSIPMTYEQSQAIMLNAAPESAPPSEEASEAFNGMIHQNMPLTPQQVVKLRQVIDASQRAATIPATVPPKPMSTTLMMNLAPGATPPAIRLSQGYISTLVFVDSAGSPWPVAAYDLGDVKSTNIQWDGKSNILVVQSVSPYGDSNLVVRLVGLATPLTLELVSGQRVVDFRTDIHVPGMGPNSKDLPTGTPLPESANQLLLSVLDGVAPSGSRELTVKGGDCQAWLLGDKMFLRTRLTVLSPGWVGRMTSPDGMIAYEIQRTSSILVSQYGNPIELKVEGF